MQYLFNSHDFLSFPESITKKTNGKSKIICLDDEVREGSGEPKKRNSSSN